MTVRRLDARDVGIAKRLFFLLAKVFEEDAEERGEGQVEALLSDPRFWAVAAIVEGDVIGGATAHTIPLTHRAASALFVYDIAVGADHQRRGVGREIVGVLRTEAARQGIDEVFVLADNADAHALAFYRALGGCRPR